MRLFWGRNWLLLASILGLSACQGAPMPHVQQSPRPTATAPAADPQRCDRLAKRGFTPCPPTPDRLQLPPTTIRNATNGAVSDATAQQWGRAFQLAQAYYYWAMQHNARNALTSGVLADSSPEAVGDLFGSDLQDLDMAKQMGGELEYQPPATPTTLVVAIPDDLQVAMRRQNLTPSSYGLAVRFVGPTRRSIRLSDGHEQVIVSHDATYSTTALVWGEAKTDPDLGSIWYEHGYYGCDGSVRSVCQV